MVAQAPDPTLVLPDAVPVQIAPVVIVTESAPQAMGDSSANSATPLLLIAGLLLLGGGLVLLLQTRK
jgi:LPXTG-motif cell wall-anchored protein